MHTQASGPFSVNTEQITVSGTRGVKTFWSQKCVSPISSQGLIESHLPSEHSTPHPSRQGGGGLYFGTDESQWAAHSEVMS